MEYEKVNKDLLKVTDRTPNVKLRTRKSIEDRIVALEGSIADLQKQVVDSKAELAVLDET